MFQVLGLFSTYLKHSAGVSMVQILLRASIGPNYPSWWCITFLNCHFVINFEEIKRILVINSVVTLTSLILPQRHPRWYNEFHPPINFIPARLRILHFAPTLVHPVLGNLSLHALSCHFQPYLFEDGLTIPRPTFTIRIPAEWDDFAQPITSNELDVKDVFSP